MQTAGLVDLQVNGFAGIDFNDAALTAEALDHALAAMLRTGVTCCLPTVITASADELTVRLRALDRAVAGSRLGPAMVPGYHLEGPFLNPGDGYAGCHPAACMVPPEPALLDRLRDGLARPILLLTLAPEHPGAEALIRHATAAGMLVAIGHAAAHFDDVPRAAAAGATLSTHLGNGLPQVLPKLDNTIFAQLAEDRLTACFIADGIHLPPPALRVMIRAKGIARAVLVTDAVAAACVPTGRYPFAGMTVERDADGAVRVPGGRTLAGSALTLDAAVRNVVSWGIATPDDAARMASAHPAALLARLGVVPGEAEIEWSADMRVRRVRACGMDLRIAEGEQP